tara:strand:- start:1210 stop:2082 length:873 start_codon:yes stop_codon:yes gene_type:complete
MDKLLYLIIEGIKNIWRHKMTAITAVFSLFISLYIIGLIATAGTNSYKLIQYFRSKYKIEIFFKPEISNAEAIGLIHKIKKIEGVLNATIIEKEDAVRIFKDQFGEDVVELLGYNPLPASAVINLKRNMQQTLRVDPIIKKIRSINGIDEIRYQGNLIKKIERNYKRVIDRLPYISAVIVFIATLIIYNTIKLSVYARKETIKTLQLIGATRIFVKLPFIFEGIFIGIISVSLVFPALILTIKTLNYLISNFSPFSIKIGFDPFVYVWMFLLIFVISLVGSYRATSSFLK